MSAKFFTCNPYLWKISYFRRTFLIFTLSYIFLSSFFLCCSFLKWHICWHWDCAFISWNKKHKTERKKKTSRLETLLSKQNSKLIYDGWQYFCKKKNNKKNPQNYIKTADKEALHRKIKLKIISVFSSPTLV